MACKHKSRVWENGWCNVACSYCTLTQESTCKHNKQTNADRIRAMSDEELAKMFMDLGEKLLNECGVSAEIRTTEYALKWLKQPVEVSDNEKAY